MEIDTKEEASSSSSSTFLQGKNNDGEWFDPDRQIDAEAFLLLWAPLQ